MKKQFRILLRKDFVRIAGSGFYFRIGAVVVQCDTNDLNHFRVGFTASKKVGNAVIRNRCKRRMRAAAEVVLSRFAVSGIDYVIIAKRATATISWDVLLESIQTAVLFLNQKCLNAKNRAFIN